MGQSRFSLETADLTTEGSEHAEKERGEGVVAGHFHAVCVEFTPRLDLPASARDFVGGVGEAFVGSHGTPSDDHPENGHEQAGEHGQSGKSAPEDVGIHALIDVDPRESRQH